MPDIVVPTPPPPPSTEPQESGMIVPFTSYSWVSYAGKFGLPMIKLFVDSPSVADVSAQLMRRTKGRRVIAFQNAAYDTFSHPGDVLQGRYGTLWYTNGIARSKLAFQAIVDGLATRRTDLDFAVFDVENGPSSYVFTAADLAAIHADGRYAALVASGDFPADPRNMDEPTRMHFNYGCAKLFMSTLVACCIDPLYSHYPNLAWSNFNDFPITKADAQNVRDFNGHATYFAPSDAPYYSPANYATVYQLANTDARFKTPWGCLAWCLNNFRVVYRAKAGAKLMPWLGTRADSNVLDLNHWLELIYHTCCVAGPRLLYFNGDDPTALTNWRYDNAVAQYVSAARGSTWSKTVTTDLTDYANDQVVVTAARLVNGSTVGRATFKPGVKSARITVAGKTLTVTPETGGVGCWFKF